MVRYIIIGRKTNSFPPAHSMNKLKNKIGEIFWLTIGMVSGRIFLQFHKKYVESFPANCGSI